MQIGSTTISITQSNPSLQIYNVIVSVIRPVNEVTSTGTEETETTLIASLSAHIVWRTGRERILFDKSTYFRDATLICRTPAGVVITTRDRVRHNGLDYEIVSLIDIRNLGRRLRMDIRRIA